MVCAGTCSGSVGDEPYYCGKQKTGDIDRGILVKFFFQFICVMVLGAIGYILIMSHQDFPAFMHISMAVMPYLWLGYLLRNYVRDFTQYVNGFVALAALIVVIIVSRRYLISLVNNYVYPFMYPLAVLESMLACIWRKF